MVIFQSYVSLPEGIVHFHGTSIYKWMTKGTPIVGNLHILDIPQKHWNQRYTNGFLSRNGDGLRGHSSSWGPMRRFRWEHPKIIHCNGFLYHKPSSYWGTPMTMETTL